MEGEALRILTSLCDYLDGGKDRKVISGSPMHEQIKSLIEGYSNESKATA